MEQHDAVAADPALETLLHADEPLDPALDAYLRRTSLGPCIRHPLVYSILHHDSLNALVNAQLANKQAALADAVARADWDSVVFLHERPWRAEALHEHAHLIPDTTYWELLARVWADSENIRELPHLWDGLLHDQRPGREAMMDAAEHAALAALPDRVTIWQGHTDSRHDGWSWTTDRDTAVWFAQRFAHLEQAVPMLRQGAVRRADVAAYLLRRGESEILVDPACVDVISDNPLGH